MPRKYPGGICYVDGDMFLYIPYHFTFSFVQFYWLQQVCASPPPPPSKVYVIQMNKCVPFCALMERCRYVDPQGRLVCRGSYYDPEAKKAYAVTRYQKNLLSKSMRVPKPTNKS